VGETVNADGITRGPSLSHSSFLGFVSCQTGQGSNAVLNFEKKLKNAMEKIDAHYSFSC